MTATKQVILDKWYSGESICDIDRDVSEALDEQYTAVYDDIPVDEHGFSTGSFRVLITWEPEDEE